MKAKVQRCFEVLAIAAGGSIIGALIALNFIVPWLASGSQDAVNAAYKQGHAQGLASQDWQKLAMQEPKFSNKLCHAWWFPANPKDKFYGHDRTSSKNPR